MEENPPLAPPPCEGGIPWLRRFEAAQGRPLRVLHIGNIANNAYNNAKIQRQWGIEADVLCHDYYHIMSCPEWEDANYAGELGDPNFPDWWSVDLRGFKRPEWFVQGHLDPCLRTLLAQRTGLRLKASIHRRLCEFDRWMLCGRSERANRVRAWIKRNTGRDVAYLAAPALSLVAHWIAERLKRFSSNRLIQNLKLVVHIRRMRETLLCYARQGNFIEDKPAHMAALVAGKDEILRRARELLAPLGRTLTAEDLEWFFEWWWHPRIAELLNSYDIVQAYGIFPAMPFIASRRPYLAYEHGTIRSIPFANDMHGRMCALSYLAAAGVFVTNSDNIEAAERLGIDNARLVYLPHAFDTDKLERFADQHDSLQPNLAGPCVFFSPTRQDWQDGDPSWTKGNDRFLHGAAQIARDGTDFRIVLVEWGRDLEATRALIFALGLENRVQWLPTLRKRELWRQYLQSHCVVDQFVIPAIGGVSFEAMALGRRVITAVDKVQMQRFFGEPPPLHAARTAEEVAVAMRAVIDDLGDTDRRGPRNRDWINRRHSAKRIVGLQLGAYEQLLNLAPVPTI